MLYQIGGMHLSPFLPLLRGQSLDGCPPRAMLRVAKAIQLVLYNMQ